MNSAIAKNILKTIVYYDILNYPLASFEVWKYLIVEMEIRSPQWRSNLQTLGDIIEALESKEIKKHIEEFQGFYFLRGRKNLVEQRIQNDKHSIVKFKIAERVAWWMRFVPFVRMIAVTGTLAMKNSEKNSDIDFFVVLEKGRIFTGRMLVTLMVHLLGKRRYGKKIKNRICLNYFLTTGSLEIKQQDLFAANEYSFIYPIFDSLVIPAEAGIQKVNGFRVPPEADKQSGMTKKSVFCQFGEANNRWIQKYKPNFEFSDLIPAKYFVEVKPLQRKMQGFFESLINLFWGDRIELWLKKKQIEKIKRNPLTYKKGGYVEYDDDNLVFLPEPQGVRIEKYFYDKLKNINS